MYLSNYLLLKEKNKEKDQDLKKFFFNNFIKNNYFFFKKNQPNSNLFIFNKIIYIPNEEESDFKSILLNFKKKFEKDKEINSQNFLKKTNRYNPGFALWNFLNINEEVLWRRMNELWIVSVRYFLDDKHEDIFKKINEDKKEDNEMFIYNPDDLNHFLGISDDEDADEDLFTGLCTLDDEDPDFLEIYDDDMFNITFIWSFFAYCLIFCFDFTGIFILPILPLIICHYLMYYPDFLAEEESDDPENIIIDNIYNSDMSFVNYQFENFIKYNFTLKQFDFLNFIKNEKFTNINLNFIKNKKLIKFKNIK